MRTNLLLLSCLLFFVFQFQEAQSKDKSEPHNFKIVGSTRLQTSSEIKTVEYDSINPDHLYITSFHADGKIKAKRSFLFTGKIFDLSEDFLTYINKKQIMMDGSHTSYNKDGLTYNILIYSKDKIITQILFYPNGQKRFMVPGGEELNGEYKLWYPTGQISFSGVYKDNKKEGDFELFDESGATLKKGLYKQGKLISGEAVVPDIIYNNPEVPARYAQGEAAFNDYLTEKAADLNDTLIVYTDKKFYMEITFDKTGKMITINNYTVTNHSEGQFIQILLKDCPAFSPATIEGTPVQSQQSLTLSLHREGIKLMVEEKIYTEVDEMPEFPGGPMALRNYLASGIKYPEKAAASKIQGKVFVNFVVDKDGFITDARVVRGCHPLLDAEAMRVVAVMPKWKAGRLKGKPAKVSYTLPVDFLLATPPKRSLGYAVIRYPE
jgi:TonB family protein